MRRALATTALAVALGGCGLKDPYSPTMPTNVARPQVAATAMTGVTAPVPRNANAPLAAAQAFMRGYVPYLYGLGRAAKIGPATSHLKRSLAAQPMTRDDGASPAHPRLEALRVL